MKSGTKSKTRSPRNGACLSAKLRHLRVYTSRMKALTSQQKRKLAELMATGFEDYAVKAPCGRHVGALTDSTEENRALISKYGKEFCRILDTRLDALDCVATLQRDLFNLIKQGCPLRDIIDLTFACTTGRGIAISDSLESVGFDDSNLNIVKLACFWLEKEITKLNAPQVPGPLFFLEKSLPGSTEEELSQIRLDIQRLPGILGFYGDLLRLHPRQKEAPALDSFLRECELGFLYLLLSHFNRGFPTLSCLLRTMRQVRYNVTPNAHYLRPFRRVGVTRKESSDPGVRDARDPFSEGALQQGLYRLFHERIGNYMAMRIIVDRYLSDEYSDRRAQGAILVPLMFELADLRSSPLS